MNQSADDRVRQYLTDPSLNLDKILDEYPAAWAVPEPTWTKTCACGGAVKRYRGEGDVECPDCEQPYNAFGQVLNRYWQHNPSNDDEDVSDLDGYEVAALRGEDG